MKYDFDRVIDRTGTGSFKWDLADALFHGSGLLPLWVADMDFESPPEVIEALVMRARHGIFGYTAPGPAYHDAIIKWFRKRHRWKIRPEWLRFAPGVVPALNLLVQAFTAPGDSVIVQMPVYYPFMRAISLNGRTVLNNPLKLEKGRYRMDLEDLERKAMTPGARLIILCSPHNPVGRVWTRDELEGLGSICLKRGILVVADEIHCDLTYQGVRHVPFASIKEEFLMNSVTCLSPSKTFNLAGLQTAALVIAGGERRAGYETTLSRLGLTWPNVFGSEALTAAYTHGAPWLDALIDYLAGNLEFLKQFIARNIPGVTVIEPEGTYLVWLDFRGLDMDNNALKRLMIEDARVALDHGFIFGSPEGDGFERINIACPRATLEEALRRIERALKSRFQEAKP
ncbi:MAG: pyridoxal phosphate-dependent aminotransferase [Spirochaetes bacterium]|nr:pyridoxal phosphate-dependent aminotransferase [Spirochaetota bacterium]